LERSQKSGDCFWYSFGRCNNYVVMKVSSNTSVAMPIKNMIGIIAAVAAGIFAYTELTARLVSLETSRELMSSDLLKASDQKPIDQEQFLIQESLASDLEKTITRVDDMMHNGVNISRMIKDIERLRTEVEKLKDKVRANGNHQ
jgi:L-cysteine desulfidase